MLKLNMRSGVSVGTVNQVTFLAGCEIQAQNMSPVHIYTFTFTVILSRVLFGFLHQNQLSISFTAPNAKLNPLMKSHRPSYETPTCLWE